MIGIALFLYTACLNDSVPNNTACFSLSLIGYLVERNIEELLYAATLTNDPAKQEAIYTQATKQFPNDYRAYNNLGKLAYQAGNVDKAESYLKKAASVNAAAMRKNPCRLESD